MFRKKLTIFIIIIILLVIAGFLLVPKIAAYYEWQSVVEAASAMPWQDGGTIIMVREPCVLDTPSIDPVTCAKSCPMVTSVYGTACTGYIEIETSSQNSTAFLAPPIGFTYQGGGTHPKAGTQYISGGASNALPWVIGIPK